MSCAACREDLPCVKCAARMVKLDRTPRAAWSDVLGEKVTVSPPGARLTSTLARLPVYTLSELAALVKHGPLGPDTMRTVNAAKRLFAGTVLPPQPEGRPAWHLYPWAADRVEAPAEEREHLQQRLVLGGAR